jgi:hypothetical protein
LGGGVGIFNMLNISRVIVGFILLLLAFGTGYGCIADTSTTYDFMLGLATVLLGLCGLHLIGMGLEING